MEHTKIKTNVTLSVDSALLTELKEKKMKRKAWLRKAKWAVIGATLFMYVTIVLIFYYHVFYLQLSAFMIIGFVFGNWAGGEEKEEARRKWLK